MMNKAKHSAAKTGYDWTKPKRLVSVRIEQDESRMAKRLSLKLGMSQNRVFVEALRRLYNDICSVRD